MKDFAKIINSYYLLSEEENIQRQQNYLDNIEFIHASMGLAGEAGEVLDLVKKSVNYNTPLDREKFLDECGDTLHYLVRTLAEQGFTLDDAASANLRKLERRYPDGYSNAAAVARKDMR